MRKVIKYVVSFFFIFLLFPISLIAGEIIEADCEDPEWVYLNEVKMRLLINTDGGKQTIADENFADVTFTKDKVVMKERDGDTLTIDIESGSLYYNGKNIGHCIFSNLEVLEKGNTADADDGEIIQLLESIKIQQDKILEKLDANSITDHSLLAHEHGEKVSLPCSAQIKVEQDYSDKWNGTMWTKFALTDSLLKAHNAISETDGKYPIPMEVEITTNDGEKISMIVGYNIEVSGGNMLRGFQTYGDLNLLFEGLSEEAEKDIKMKKYGEFLNVTCSFNSHSVQYH